MWVTNVKLPGMLHARMVHPTTLGSKLVSAGQVDKKQFPNAQVVVKGNLVGVVAPTEWEAIQASRQVATATKWSDWKGLPGNAQSVPIFPSGRRLEIGLGEPQPEEQGRRPVGDGGRAEEALRHLRNAVHEARADRTHHGAGRCTGPTAQSPSTRTIRIPRHCAVRSL